MLQAINARRQSQAIIPSSTASVYLNPKIPFPSEAPSSLNKPLPSSRPASPAPTSEAAAEEDDTDATNPATETEEETNPVKDLRTSTAPAVKEEVAEAETPRRRPESLFELMTDGDWLYAPMEKRLEYQREIERVASTFKDEVELEDPTMVAEYADEIFEYMSKLEEEAMPMPNYMAGQQEITWDMRATLIDWLLQVHLRYHMLPETLWIAINIVDRFLSKRVVSVVKLQLVGVTAMFVAAKYEEIVAPSVDEYVKMTEGGYKKEEILKGEKIVLQTIDFKISSYCSPYSWVRRISKADDYNLQTRTLCKFLMEMTLLDHRFLRAKPSMIAAIGMYSARKMLGLDWVSCSVSP
jgi:G2/mitotic-specific cyclin 2